MQRRTASSFFTWGTLLGVASLVGFVALSWAEPASAQISTAFDITGLGTRSPVEIALSLINWMLGILALIAVVFILYGGFLWLTSAGSEEKIEQAKRVLINAGIGLLIILAAWGIVLYILSVLLGATGAGNVNGGSGGGGYGGGFPDSASTFYVRNTDPQDEEGDVVLCTDIYILFSKDIDTTTATTSTLSSDSPTFYLRAVDASTLQDKAGSGEACSANTDCASAACDASTFTCTGDNVSGTIEIDDLDSGETTDHFSFLPSSDFESDTTYMATVAGGSSGVISETSTGALSMDQDYTFTFTTGTSTDTTSPVVEEISGSSPFPADGETDVCLNTPINYQFSEAIRTYTVDDDTSFLVSADSSIPSTTLVDLRSFDFGGDRVYAMARPTSALTANSTYYSELYGGDIDATSGAFSNVITDACGNPLDGDFDGSAEGNTGGDDYFPPSYDFDDDGVADDPLDWQTGENASCVPLIESISPTNEYYGYGDDPTTTDDDSDSTSISFTGEYLSPNPEIIFNDTIYSSSSDLSCFDQELPPNEETVCFLSASLAEDTTKLPVGSQDGDVRIVVADEGSECLFDEDADGNTSCAFTVDSPFIDYIDQHESAPGDYVTVGGENFGDNEGFVYFRADEETVLAGYPEYVVADLPDACGDTWSSTQVVVVVPDDYPVGTDLDVQLETEDGHWSNLSYFTVSDTDRPSLCSMAPECNDAGAQSTTLTGKKLGSSGIVYYGTGVGTSTSWNTSSITAVSPGDITDGEYYVTVEVDGVTSNGLEYTVPCTDNNTSGTPAGNSTFYVRSTDPEDDETDVTLCTDVYALFSDDITVSSATESNFYLQIQGGGSAGTSCSANTDCASALCSGGTCQESVVSGSIELDSDASTNGTDHASFLPSTDFEANTTYLGTLVGGSSGILGEDGTAMDDDYTFTFTTGTTTDTVPPYVVESSSSPYPADGATDVCLNTAVAFSFSEAMRTYTFDDSNSVLIASSSDFGTASLENLQSFDFGADRDSATTRVLNSLDAETEYYSRLYGGDLQSDGTYDNVVTDACGNPLDGDFDGSAEGAHTDDYLDSADSDQPINWTTGTTAECAPIITSISPTSEYYGVSGLTDDYLSIEGFYLTPNPDIVFYHNQYSSDGEDTCFDTDTPPDVEAECYDSTSSEEHELLSKVPVGSEDGSVSVTVAGLNSTCSFDADGDGSTSCQISVNSPFIEYVSPSDAAAGDYVTLGGANFGSATGTVYFRSSDGTDVEAELPPSSCGDTWSDTQIVVVVPDDFAVGTALDVQVQTSGSLGAYYSNLEDFEVSDANRPSVCSVSPSCHDSAGQSATITGQKFGTTGTVNYGETAGTSTAWDDTSITAVAPSSLAQDEYYLTVTDSSGNDSNGVSYSIPCNNAPQVVEINTCSESSGIYPVPNPLPDEEEACINSDIEVMFDMDMEDSTFTTSTLTLVECNTVVSGEDDPFSSSSCSTTNLIQSSFIDQTETVTYDTSTYYGFRVDPDDFDPNTWYQLTISTGVESSAGVALAEDYTYHFKVRDSSEACAISSISVQPSSITANAYCADANGDGDTSDADECPRTDGEYSGSAYSAECLLLDSDSYTWSWTITNPTGDDCTDADDDGLSTAQETAQSTDAADSDTDNDTYEDGWEVDQGTDPLVATSVPTSSADLTADDICEDSETCVEVAGVGTCTSLVGDFSNSGSGDFTSSGADVTVYPGGNDNYNQGTAEIDAEASGLTDDAQYKVDFGYCETDRDCEISCAGSTCDDSINRCSPVVNSFSPTSGELGTWVTIDGCMFGPSKGNVQWEDGSTVIDTNWPDEVLCGDTWSDTQIIAEFPELYAADSDGVEDDTVPTSSYAVNVINTYSLEDTTTSEFQVDSTVHAGLCRVSPESQSIGESVALYGQNFDVTEGAVSFNPSSGSTSPSSRVSADPDETTWADTQISTVVPDGAQTGLSSASEEGVKVVLSDGTTESNAVDFTVSYTAPTVESSDPADGDVDICPNAALTVTFSEEMTGLTQGVGGNVRVYKVGVDDDGITETLSRVALRPISISGSTITITPRTSLDVSSDYRIVLMSESSTQIVGVNSGLNLEGGTTQIDFTTSAVICTPDHIEVSLSANELEENLDLDSSGAIEDMDVNLSSWTYTEADESREWTARMYDSSDNELANVSDLSWTWSWSPLYDETACVNAVWVSTVEGDSDLDLLDDEYENVIGTDPEDYDSDGDGIGDGWELEIDTDPLDQNSYPNVTDVADHDGLLVSEETQYGTDYTEYDTDSDGYGDGWEVLNGTDPLDETEFPTVADPGTSADADADGLFEVTGATEETDVASTGDRATDTDGDGYGDIWETSNSTDPNDSASIPSSADPGTNSSDNDTDGDSWLDGWEVLYGSDPSDSASEPDLADPGTDDDGDGLGSVEEGEEGTNNSDYDSDDDGFGDGWEVDHATDPSDAASYPTEAETLTGLDESQTVVSGSTDNETSSVAVTANALAGWSGSLSTSSSVSVQFCSGDSWQYSDSNQKIMLWYCDDDHTLPDLDGPAVTAGTDYIRQYLFPSEDDANDTIGVRVYANSTDFLTPEEWVLENVPNAGDLSLSSTTIDGYPAVRSTNAVYVSASYVGSSSASYRLYNNIYLITWTQGGDAETIASKLLENWQFNTNVDDSATTDTISGPDQGCVYSSKSKLQRDTERMIELNTTASLLEDQYTEDSEYPLPKSDTVSSYIEHISNSVWPSWQGALGNVLGEALGEDPINAFLDATDADGNTITDYLNADASNECPYSPDTNEFFDESGTCWDNVNLDFYCPDNSYVYLYKLDESDSTDAWLYGHMEYTSDNASTDIYYPNSRYNTYASSSTTYSPCGSSYDCSCFNFAVNSENGATFTGGE